METIFFKLLSMSIPASILIGVVVLLRVLLRKSPKWVHCILWGLVAIRLVCPFSIESKFSLVPNAEAVNTRLAGEQVLIQPGVTYTAQPESDDVTKPKQQEQPAAVEKVKQWNVFGVISWVWLAGCMTLSAYAFICWFKVRRSVRLSVRTQENIYICDRIRSPFILGVIRPRIYLPSNMSDVQKENVIAHEKAHIKRLDYLWKPFGFFLLSVYWFNPLCWLAYILLCRDIELACDEKVIRDMDVNQKKIYSEVLLSFSDSEKVITACPLAFGEVGARQRIKAVLSYKKPGFWIIVTAVVLIVVTSVLFLTNPKRVDHLNEVPVDSYSESEGTEEPAMDKNEFVRTWAEAFCDRDGETIVSMSSDYVKEILEEEGLLIQGDDYVSFGWSSPWPMWEEGSGYTCIYQDDEKTKAEILYYAWMSEPHVTVWKECITFEEAGDSFVVTGEELKMYDSVEEAADFDAAYPVINGTLMDYTKNEFGEVLGRNIMRDNTDLLKKLQNPCHAARYFLNLNENLNIWVSITNDEEIGYSLNDADNFAGQNTVDLCIEFDGGENIRTITMIKLDDTSGIWVPQDYGEDVIDSAYEDGI